MKTTIEIDVKAMSVGLKSYDGKTITIADIKNVDNIKLDGKDIPILNLITSDGISITCGHGAISRSTTNDKVRLPIKDGKLTIDFPITGKVDFDWSNDKKYKLYFLAFDEAPAKFAVA